MPRIMTVTYLLTADVGGTNSRMSLYQLDQEQPLEVKYFRNATTVAPHVAEENAFGRYIVEPFLEHCWKKLQPPSNVRIVACLATAGVVQNNRVNMTNLDNLLVDGNALERCQEGLLKYIKVCRLINDFVAQGYGCLTLQPHEVEHLHGPNSLETNGPKVCVGAGTGLGVCYLTPTSQNDNYQCFPSEGGHVEYAPRNPLEGKLWEYLRNKFTANASRISVERIVSGKGLANVYEFLMNEYPKESKITQEFLKAGDEQGKVVAENVGKDSLASQAMDILMSAYGCHVGSTALTLVPTGGLFVTGGLTPKNLHHIVPNDSEFRKGYTLKGRVSPLLETIPLFAVLVEDLGVRGAHHAAKELAREHPQGPSRRVPILVATMAVVVAATGLILARKK